MSYIEHNFDRQRGQNEKIVQDILFREGNKTILEAEKGEYKVKTPDGLLNGLKMDIKTIEGAGNNTIKNAFNSAKKQGAEHVVLYFANALVFNVENLNIAYARYAGATKNSPIKKIWYIVNDKIYRFK